MLGEMIGELRGKITGNRVLSVECCPKIESSFQETGKILDIDVTGIGTFWGIIKEDGELYGEGQGIITTSDGENATWEGQGIGKMKGKGTEWIASIFFNTYSNKLSHLKHVIGLVEFQIDEEGNTHDNIWEWKQK